MMGIEKTRPAPIMVLALLIVVAGIVLRVPLVTAPFFGDDLHQLEYLDDSRSSTFSFRNGFDLFRFFDGDRSAAEAKIASGDLPWRFNADQRAAFFRPLSSAMMWLDYEVFGLDSLAAHVHSLLWFLALLFVLWRLFVLLLEPRAALLATAAVAVAPTTTFAITWWACRYALIVSVFAAAALLFHVRWCRTQRTGDMLLAALCVALSLLAAESGLQGLAFIFAYTVVHAWGSWRSIIRFLLPGAAIVAIWAVIRRSLGYGVENNALYVDPVTNPGDYLSNVGSHLADVLAFAVGLEWVTPRSVWPVIVLFLSVLAVCGYATYKSRSSERNALFGWLLPGSVLALAPCFASRLGVREWQLIVPQIGVFAMFGSLAVAAWDARGLHRSRVIAVSRLAALLLFALYLLVPLYTQARTAGLRLRGKALRSTSLPFTPRARAALTSDITRLILVRSPDPVRPVGFLRLWDGFDDLHDELSVITLSDTVFARSKTGDCAITRTGPRRLLVTARPVVRSHDFYRSRAHKQFATGQIIHAGDVAIRIDATRGTETAAIEYAFAEPLEDERSLLLVWLPGTGFDVLAPPPIGESVETY